MAKCHGWGFKLSCCWSEKPEFEHGALNHSAMTLPRWMKSDGDSFKGNTLGEHSNYCSNASQIVYSNQGVFFLCGHIHSGFFVDSLKQDYLLKFLDVSFVVYICTYIRIKVYFPFKTTCMRWSNLNTIHWKGNSEMRWHLLVPDHSRNTSTSSIDPLHIRHIRQLYHTHRFGGQ